MMAVSAGRLERRPLRPCRNIIQHFEFLAGAAIVRPGDFGQMRCFFSVGRR